MVVEALIGISIQAIVLTGTTHKTRQNTFHPRNTNFCTLTDTSRTGRTKTFNIIPVALLLGQGGEYFTPFSPLSERESEGERGREVEDYLTIVEEDMWRQAHGL